MAGQKTASRANVGCRGEESFNVSNFLKSPRGRGLWWTRLGIPSFSERFLERVGKWIAFRNAADGSIPLEFPSKSEGKGFSIFSRPTFPSSVNVDGN